MAYSKQSVVSDGTLVTLGITIEYFDRTEISVLFNDVLVAEGSGWAWVGTTDQTLSFTPAVPNLTEVTVVRSTDIADIRHSLEGGAAYTDQTMDENFKQVLHIAQEAREGLQLGDIYQDLNMHGFRMINIADPVNPADAMSYGAYQADVSGNFAAAVATATASASASAATATAQKDAAVVAKDAAVAAKVAAEAAAASITLPIPVASGGTGATSAVNARANLGLANTPTVTALQAEMEAGAEAALRSMSPLLVAQAIAALATGRLTAGTPAVQNPYALSATVTQAHGLGVEPWGYKYIFECLSAELGFSVGDKVVLSPGAVETLSDATNTVLIVSSSVIWLTNKTTYVAAAVDPAKWKLTVTPYKLN